MRSIKHWTPRYVWNRSRLALTTWRHPHLPWLTIESVRLLEQLLRPTDRGVEWGAGRSTLWFAERTAHLTSFEGGEEFGGEIRRRIESLGVQNVDFRIVPFDDSLPEEELRTTEWFKQSAALPDESFDYALVDTSPRGLNALTAIQKLKRGGLLIADNLDWYLVPPQQVQRTPGATTANAGTEGSRYPLLASWREIVQLTKDWRRIWTSDGISMTAIYFKP